ncbi:MULTISPECIES: hypothetical protein [unclassified Streptomyces]|uniref:hypothetical protein n=1 Tax=unclassified Streptomyces TaxID=2593676 RepID=UPI000F453770|nr:hypothetical protein [Streptomyces sp. I6]RNL74389.1 hypothetical protein EBF04_28405 [Streptomyces sp. I6]
MILTAVLIPPALLLLIVAMDRLEDRLFAVPQSPRHARRRRRPRFLPRRRAEPGPDEREQPSPGAA